MSSTKYAKLIEEVGHCELCGSKRNMEVHHIVPKVCCEGIIDADREDNLIVVCGSCHSRLTPRRFLPQYGINKLPEHKHPVKMKRFYDNLDKCYDMVDIIDLVDFIWADYLDKPHRDAIQERLGIV